MNVPGGSGVEPSHGGGILRELLGYQERLRSHEAHVCPHAGAATLGQEDDKESSIHYFPDARTVTVDHQGIGEVSKVPRVAVGVPGQYEIP